MLKNKSFVFIVANITIFTIVALSLMFPKATFQMLKFAQDYSTAKFGWFYILGMSVIFFVMIFLCLSRFGNIKLGPDHAKPQYKNLSWFAMLFSAGMGIGIMFFGVGEPVMHYLSPPQGDPQTIEAARKAMNITFFHWGLNAWGVYGFVAVVLAYFSYRHNLPLSLRSAFYPLLGKGIYGRFGDWVDIFAVIATLFGVVTTLGYGVLQVNAGFNYIFSMPVGGIYQVGLIALITICVGISAVSGLDKGIKILSNTNMIFAVFLLLFILFLGNTSSLLKDFVQNTGSYLSSFVGDTFNLYAYEKKNDAWLGGWTLLYWAWWISWSPFVGLFIAKISRGRTIREFIIGVLFVPAGFCFLWMSVFGNSAIDLINSGFIELANMVNKDVALSLFIFLEKFPLSGLLSFISVLMVILFFVTSADSAAFVIDMICNNGKSTRKIDRLFWVVIIGVLASVLLYMGGLKPIQTLTMVAAFPLLVALLGSIYGLTKALSSDIEKKDSQNTTVQSLAFSGSIDWKNRLKSIIEHPDRDAAREFLDEVALKAFQELKEEFISSNLEAKIIRNKEAKTLEFKVGLGDEADFIYGLHPVVSLAPDFIDQNNYYRLEVYLREGGQDYDVLGWSKNALINDIIDQYAKHLHFLYKVR